MIRHLAHARQLVHQPGQPAHVLHLFELIAHVAEVETLALGDFLGEFRRFVLINLRLHLLDQGQHIAHVENSAGGTIRMENVEAIGLLANTDKLDRLAGDVAHRQCRATTGVAIGLGQHYAGQRQGFRKCFRGVGRILAGHGIDHEQSFHWLDRRVQSLDLGHHRFVDGQTAGGIYQQYIYETFLRIGNCRASDIHWRLPGVTGKKQHADLLRQRFQLRDRSRTVDVTTDHHHLLLTLFLQVLGQLGDGGGFASALQASHQNDRRRRHVEVEVAGLRAHDRSHFVVDDLDQGLAGREAGQHFLADGANFDPLDQGHDHGQRDVGFEQCHAHFAQRFANVVFAQTATTTQALQGAGKALGQRLKHDDFSAKRTGAKYNSAVPGTLCHTLEHV